MLVVAAAVGVASCFGAPISGEISLTLVCLMCFHLWFSHASHICPSLSFIFFLLWSPLRFIFWSIHLAVVFCENCFISASLFGSGPLRQTPHTYRILKYITHYLHVGKIIYIFTVMTFIDKSCLFYLMWLPHTHLHVFLSFLSPSSAPVGVLFSVEVMCCHFALRHYCPCFFSAACGALTFRLLSVWSGDAGNGRRLELAPSWSTNRRFTLIPWPEEKGATNLITSAKIKDFIEV